MPSTRLGIIAGHGDLPRELVGFARRQGRDVFVLAIEGQAEADTVAGVEHDWFRIPRIGDAIAILKANGVGELVLTGDFPPWHLFEETDDPWVVEQRSHLERLVHRGENEVLTYVIGALEAEGIHVVSARSFAGDMFPKKGILGKHEPDTEAWLDIALGIDVAHRIGRLDIGQSVAVQHRVVLAVEAAEGTDALIGRAGALRRPGIPGPVLVKMLKPQQETRADPPTLGPVTIRHAAAAGFRGIAIEAGGALVVEREKTVALADESGLFLAAVTAPT